jgi:Uncharacterised protein conserved in bacteria (DUF2336)
MLRGSPSEERALLAQSLAPIANAPRKIIIDLAFDDEIAVAGAVLTHSVRLDEEALLALASTKGQLHLAAIAVRTIVPAAISDVLVARGTPPVILVLVKNAGADFAQETRERVVQLAFAEPDLFVAIDRRSEFGQAVVAAYERGGHHQAASGAGAAGHDADAQVAGYVGKGEIERALAVIAMSAQTRHKVALSAYKNDTLHSFVIIARAANLSWGTMVALLLHQYGITTSAQMINTSRKLFDDTTRRQALHTTRILGLAEKTIGK